MMIFRDSNCSCRLRRIPGRRKLFLVFAFTSAACVITWCYFLEYINNKTASASVLERKSLLSLGLQNITVTNTTKPQTTNKDGFPHTYLINERDFCSNRSDLYIINVVGTAPWEAKARSRIRRLWGNEQYRNITGFSTVFILGLIEDEKIMADVLDESAKYHDVILLDFMDSYENLTLKSLVLFHWVDNFCENAVWVLKSDADVFINTFSLSRYLHSINKAENPIVCRKRGPVSPCRKDCPHVKWRVTWNDYPVDKYPVYCMGPGYAIPRTLVAPIYAKANKTHPFRIEDVYYTGILPQKLKISSYKHSIRTRFPWRPRDWQDSFVNSDLMILELDKRLGRGASSLVWENILKNRGLIPEVNREIVQRFTKVVFHNKPEV